MGQRYNLFMPIKDRDKKNAYYRDWYKKNKNWWVERRARNKQIVIEAKSKPCMDCGIEYPTYVMDFDHREGEEKELNLARIINKHWSEEHVRREIAKCDVVCSNCHRIRTHNRSASGKKSVSKTD